MRLADHNELTRLVRVLLFLLMLGVFGLALWLSFHGPSMAEREADCAKKCAAEGFASYAFTRPGSGAPRDPVVQESCRCVR
ncbi:MAG: hypothetical protein U1E63_14995 [Burkholderiales bacterium]